MPIQDPSTGQWEWDIDLPSVLMHEFGHLLGLDNLDKSGDRFKHYLMSKGTDTVQAVPSADVRYVEQVYRHHGGKPH